MRARIVCFAFFILALAPACAQAQLQRSIINPSFEMPFTGPNAGPYNSVYANTVTWAMFDQHDIPGWETSAPPSPINCPVVLLPAPGLTTYPCNPIEVWFNSYSGVPPAQGRVLVELNAVVSSKLYQNICLVNGESFSFQFSHRGRDGLDTARFEITSAGIMTVTTGNAGATGTIDATNATGSAATAMPNGWTRYSGTYVHTGPSGLQQLGFVAVNSAGGEAQGNLLDDISIALTPYVELVTSTFSVEGNPMAQVPKLRVVGRLPAPVTVGLSLSGTATPGTDYDFGGPSLLGVVASSPSGLTVTVPAGDYGSDAGNTLFDLPLRVLDDTVIEDNETLAFALVTPGAGAGYLVANGTDCGLMPHNAIVHTIIDNDIDLRASYQMSAAGQLGGTVTQTVTFSNVTPGTLTLAPSTAHEALSVTVIVPHPAGMTLGPWTCTAAGNAVCRSATGMGAFGAVVTIGSGTLTYVFVSSVPSSAALCGTSITATASITMTLAAQPPNGGFPTGALAEGTAHQGSPGFTAAPNSAEAVMQVQPCAQLSITKANGIDSVAAGGTTAYTLVVANAGPAGANNTVLRDPPAAGLQCTAVSCTGVTGAASCPAGVTLGNLQGSGILLDNFPANSSISFELTCGVLATGV